MPLQMIGTRRSGSNLLRVMLGQLPGVYTPQSTHMLEFFMPLVPYYGDLSDDTVFMQLVDDVCRCVELNPVEWSGVKLDREEIKNHCPQRDLIAIFSAIYTLAALQNNCDHEWLCKCLGYINYFDELESFFKQDLKYIYVYRDGRDVALSFIKALAGEKHHYFIAKEWARTQRLALEIGNKLPADRFFSVQYESLLQDPETICRQLADFIGLPYSDNMLKYYDSRSAKMSAGASNLWGNISRPLMTENTNKFLEQSSEEDIRIFESVAGDVLDELGYERYHVKKGQELAFSNEDITEFELFNNARKQRVINKANPEDMIRRNRQKQFVDDVKVRLGCADVSYHGNMLHKAV